MFVLDVFYENSALENVEVTYKSYIDSSFI